MDFSVTTVPPVEVGQTVVEAANPPQTPKRQTKRPTQGDGAKDLAARLLAILKEQRDQKAGRYPARLGNVVSLAGSSNSRDLLSAVKTKTFTSSVVLPKTPSSKFLIKNALDLPVALWEDVDRLAADPLLLSEVIRLKRTDTTHAFSVAELKKWLSGAKDDLLRKQFDRAVKQQIASGALPKNIGWIQIKSPRLFSLDDLKPAGFLRRSPWAQSERPVASLTTPKASGPAQRIEGIAETGTVQQAAKGGAAPAETFADRFDREFSRLDRQNGSYNFVSLFELRRALPEFSREQFDHGLKQLRQARRFRINVGEGRSGVSAEQQEAAIIEDGTVHSSVSRIKQ
jgi:hypothetical protein